MIIRNQVRIMRYSLGIGILACAITIGIIMDNFILLFGKLNGAIQIIILFVLIMTFVFFLGLSAILIGRCEIFLDENYPKKKSK